MSPAMQGRLTVVLAAVCAVFVVLAGLFWAGIGSGYSFLPADDGDPKPLPSVDAIASQQFSMPEFASFAEITQRPLFSSDRRPIPPEQAEEKEQEEPAVPLKVKLTGVIITPDLRMALLQDKLSNETVSLKLGTPMPGKQSAWILVEVKPRLVVFKNNEDKKASVELEVSGPTAPPVVQRRAAPRTPSTPAQAASSEGAEPAAQEQQDEQQKSLRQRIEARRQELRERAQKIRQQRQQRANQNKQEATQ